jgi:hypothetical protein
MNKLALIEIDGQFLIAFNFWEEYEDIEKFATIFNDELSAIITDKIDGPDCRIWKLIIDGVEILLINDDPYGNLLRADTEPAKIILRNLLPKLNDIFKDV